MGQAGSYSIPNVDTLIFHKISYQNIHQNNKMKRKTIKIKSKNIKNNKNTKKYYLQKGKKY